MINRAASLLASIALHAVVLWWYKPSDSNVPLAAGEPAGETVEVDLVEPGAPLEPLPAVEEMPPEPEPPEPTPPPEPITEPPPPPPPDAIPEPTPAPVEPPKPKPKPVAKTNPPRPAVPQPRPAAIKPGGPVTSGAVPGASAGSADGESRARYKHKVTPTYPPSLKNSRAQGRVQIMVVVSATGQPISARVSQSSGNPLFDQSALAAARASQFYPKKTLGVAVQDTVLIPYRFDSGD